MRNKKVLFITQAAVIAALYVVMTVFIAAFGLASGSIQIRVSEALCILPYFTPAAVPGLSIGCLIANLVTGAPIWDVIFGSLATLLGAIFTYLLRKHKFLCTLPPVIANALIIPPVLIFAYGFGLPEGMFEGMSATWFVWLFDVVTVGFGEIISVCVLGSLLLRLLERYKRVLFPKID